MDLALTLTLTVLRDFVSENCHAMFGDNWTIKKGETKEGGNNVYVLTKYLSLNRVK